MTEPIAYWGDQFVPLSEVKLAIHDAGFVFGATVTDLCRTFRQRVFELPRHLRRFRWGCDTFRVPLRYSDEELVALIEYLIVHNCRTLSSSQELIVVLWATPGPVGRFLGEPGGIDDARPSLCIYSYPLPFSRYAPLFRHGARLLIPEARQMSGSSVPPQVKHRSRMHWWLAEREIGPASMPLLLDQDGFITETSTANLLVVRNGVVCSPRPERILQGISLELTIELCSGLGIPFEFADLRPEDCFDSAEAFLASTPYGIAPVCQLNDLHYGLHLPVFERLLTGWSQYVGLDIRQQMLSQSHAGNS